MGILRNRNIYVYQCDICSKIYENRDKRPYITKCDNICSSQCRKEANKPDGIISIKRKATCLEKFGAENPFASEACKDKMRKTLLKNYGVEYSHQIEAVKEKTKATWLEKYGVDNPTKSPEILAKSKVTANKNWGVDYFMQHPNFREAMLSKNIAVYGTPYVLQSEAGREKVKQTCLERYEVTSFTKTQEYANMKQSTGYHKSGYVKFRDRDIWCRSSYEQIFVKWLEENKDVEDITCNIGIDYKYESKKKKYFIDFCVTFKSGKRVLYEVKSKYGTTLLQNIAKFEAGRVYAKKFGYECFLVVTEDDFDNLKSF